MTDELLSRVAAAIAGADAILIGAGAGMGVDSGLPDFRGPQGFWRAYPPYERLGLHFSAIANPRWFVDDPELAWGFYGHRMGLYRRTEPHEGFAILRRWADRMPRGGFVYTSNVDGHFQRAGFDPNRVAEMHGTIVGMQCLSRCGIGIFPSDPFEVAIDLETMRAIPPLPACPGCGAATRPNILMFGDGGWDSSRTAAQERWLGAWLESLGEARIVIVEMGAGMAVPTIRIMSEDFTDRPGGTLIRINPRELNIPPGHIAIPSGALAALRAIDSLLDRD
ncbi:MAG: SIR2 family NAD-dependent protein deacylase [Isosphaeraceae bacterium]